MAITEVLSMFVVHVIETLGYFGVFIMMTLESACIPFPSEVIMPFAGFVVNSLLCWFERWKTNFRKVWKIHFNY